MNPFSRWGIKKEKLIKGVGTHAFVTPFRYNNVRLIPWD